MTIDNIRTGWAIAGAKPKGNGLRALRLSIDAPVTWATIDDDGYVGVVVALDGVTQFGRGQCDSPNGAVALSWEPFTFDFEGVVVRGAAVKCHDDMLHDAFQGFCDTWLARCATGVAVQEAFAAAQEDFRRMLGFSATRDIAVLTGLLGELLVLDQLLQRDVHALDYWAYPQGERHDFRNGGVAIEVKTTLRASASRVIVNVSSLDQLLPPPNGHLCLIYNRLERDPLGAVGLDVLTAHISERLPPLERATLIAKLDTAKLSASDGRLRFGVSEQRAFLVEGGFPCITPASFVSGRSPDGVLAVRYEIDLSTASEHMIDRNAAYAKLTAGVW